MDPDLIRAPSPEPRMPPIGEDRHTAWMRNLVRDVEYKVGRLPSKAQGEIIRRRYLSREEPLPTDTEVWMSLRKDGMAMAERTYDRIKQEALSILADAFRVTVEEAP